tara:strand:+ start:62 stop:799 length:738 start_codon:yes stop_codon:yes gene_type:complete
MKFKYLIIFFLFVSCAGKSFSSKNVVPYNGKGFALIFSEDDYENKIVSLKLKNDKPYISTNVIGAGKILRLTNPENKKTIEIRNYRKSKYPSFYKILINKKVANQLSLNKDVPFVEIQEIKKNKSFVAKETTTFYEEKKISNKAPITKVKIDNISKDKSTNQVKKSKKFDIILGEFYSINSAKLLEKRLKTELKNFNLKMLRYNIKNKYKVELSAGPYSNINTLKKDFISLTNFGFEDLDIKIYD